MDEILTLKNIYHTAFNILYIYIYIYIILEKIRKKLYFNLVPGACDDPFGHHQGSEVLILGSLSLILSIHDPW